MGRLRNFEGLAKLNEHLSNLTESEGGDLTDLVNRHMSLLSDVPTRTSIIGYDIAVGCAP